MCGIAGEFRTGGQPASKERLAFMSGKIAHRGPDGEGIWIDGHVGFVHRRLALVDLSPGGAQPMRSQDGRYTIVFNGEIYNYQALRKGLEQEGVEFRSTSDTEVLLALFARKGRDMLAELRGMFAFAIWDAQEERLFFARDRIGKKPFFYRWDGKVFAFASEVKALTQERVTVDWESVRLFLGLQYVPSPWTGFREIVCLPPGFAGTVDRKGLNSPLPYDDVWKTEPTFTGTVTEAASEVRRLLEEGVRLRLIADVPVGAFLSGGIDSAAVVALASKQMSGQKLQTFTMGFADYGFDERSEAEQLALAFGTEHHAFEAKPGHVAELVDTLVGLYDVPYADSSCLPTWLLARETKPFVKAVLTGDGGDELFAGYRRYEAFARASALNAPGLGWLAINGARVFGSITGDARYPRFAATLQAMARTFGHGYARLFTGSYFASEDLRALCKPEFLSNAGMDAEAFVAKHYVESKGIAGALDFDRRSYLPDDLCVKMDRATMAHGLEARSPFLDQELARFVAKIPWGMLYDRDTLKSLLRRAMKGVVPEEVFMRPKRGFQVPLAAWFRGELRPLFVERCLTESSPLLTFMQKSAIERLLKENDRGTDHGNRLWMLTVLATWLTTYV
jgi:asparagine synthase (glutamine-hydrolysing)